MSTPSNTFEVFQFRADERRESEPMGTKTKFWFFRDDDQWLFKEGYQGTGDKWSEKAAYELSRLLGLPAARVELAQLQKNGAVSDGTASKNFVPPDADLVHGNELLASTVDEYEKDRRFHQSQHRVNRILEILSQEVDEQAVDIFIGYLVFDAWIANVDRHHENWAIIQSEENDRIAPSYDHASSLGRLLDDQKRTRILEGRDRLTVQRFLTRSKAGGAVYPRSGNRQVPPYQLLTEICQIGYESKVQRWLEAVEEVSDREVISTFDRFPEGWITQPAKDFAVAILTTTCQLMRESLEDV